MSNDSIDDHWLSIKSLSQLLKNHKYKIHHNMLLCLKSRIETSISNFISDRENFEQSKFPFKHLRELYFLCVSDDPPVHLIRMRLSALPLSALDDIVSRYNRRIDLHIVQRPDTNHENNNNDALKEITISNIDANASFANDFVIASSPLEPISVDTLKAWATNSSRDELIRILPRMISDGGAVLPGQKRGGNKVSAPHYEPQILGRIPRLNKVQFASPFNLNLYARGGRPHKEPEERLIQNLALDWLLSIGVFPSDRPTKSNAFFAIVMMAFAEVGSSGAKHAFRRYWVAVAASKKRESAIPKAKKFVKSSRYAVTGFSSKRRRFWG